MIFPLSQLGIDQPDFYEGNINSTFVRIKMFMGQKTKTRMTKVEHLVPGMGFQEYECAGFICCQ